jgi:hypothetical protein
MAVPASEESVADHEGIAHRDFQRRRNEQAAAADPATDAQGLVELACECRRSECERMVRVPLYVYRRMLEAGDQYLLQAGHHAYEEYRTIISVGLMRIEERRV